MTALVYAYQYAALRIHLDDSRIARSLRFVVINRKGAVTFCLLGIMLIGTFQYLGALYTVFSFGLRLQNEGRAIGALDREVDALELKIQRAAADFSVEHKELLGSMEKISQVRYVTGKQEAVSLRHTWYTDAR